MAYFREAASRSKKVLSKQGESEKYGRFGNWRPVFCILTAVWKSNFQLIDLEPDEDFSLHYARSGYDFKNQFYGQQYEV
jgi:hypothetical protein